MPSDRWDLAALWDRVGFARGLAEALGAHHTLTKGCIVTSRRVALSIALAWPAASVPAQTLRVGTPTLVAVGSDEHPITEPHVAVDPSHPERIVAAAYISAAPRLRWPAGQDEQTCAAFLSLDSGASWTRHDFGASWCADPWVAITPDGHVIVTMVGKHPQLPQQGNGGGIAFRSSDGGRTWDSLPTGLGRNHDHPTMAVDVSHGPHRGWIYLSSHRARSADDGRSRYGVYVARSRNGGSSFDEPVYVVPNNLHNLAEMPVVLSDGTLVQSYVDASYFPDSGSKPSEVLFDRRRAWVIRSTDGGFTFSAPSFVTDACGPPPGYRLSAFAADVSRSRYDGRLYFACRAAGGGPIVVTHSRDRGETWSPVTPVEATARDTIGYPIPGLAVNDRGIVLVAWLGPSGDPRGQCGTNLYASASADGGLTFSASSLVASCAGGGDYFGITAIPGGQFRLVWPERAGGVQQLRTASVAIAP